MTLGDFESSTIQRLHAQYERILTAVVADTSVRIAEIPLITPAEERYVAPGWNETDASYDFHALRVPAL